MIPCINLGKIVSCFCSEDSPEFEDSFKRVIENGFWSAVRAAGHTNYMKLVPIGTSSVVCAYLVFKHGVPSFRSIEHGRGPCTTRVLEIRAKPDSGYETARAADLNRAQLQAWVKDRNLREEQSGPLENLSEFKHAC